MRCVVISYCILSQAVKFVRQVWRAVRCVVDFVWPNLLGRSIPKTLVQTSTQTPRVKETPPVFLMVLMKSTQFCVNQVPAKRPVRPGPGARDRSS